MIGAPLTLDEAQGIGISSEVRKMLAPEEVSRLVVLPLEADEGGTRLVVAADPMTAPNTETLLRMRHGVRTVELRPTSRETFEFLLERHFQPFWDDKGWRFPGLPIMPREEPAPPSAVSQAPSSDESSIALFPEPSAPPAEDEASSPEMEPAVDPAAEPVPEPEPGHPVVLFAEDGAKRRMALTNLLEISGFEARFAEKMEEIERELVMSPPALLVVRRDGPFSPEELMPLVRGTAGKTELRVVAEYGRSAIGSVSGDERINSFVFELSRFFLGVMAAAGGGSLERTEARARFAERTARRLGLRPREIEAVRFAALLANFDGHLKKLLARTEGEEGEARPRTDVLAPLLHPSRCPYPVAEILDGLLERYDGSGPKGLTAEEIPAGARVLTAVEAFIVLRSAKVARGEIDTRIRAHAGKALDPRVVEALLRADRAERLVNRLDADDDCERAVLVDPDPAAASLLEMRLANAGFSVEVHRDGRKALDAVRKNPPSLVISEVAVPGMDGFTLLLRMRKEEETADVPFLFVSERADRGAMMRGLELGADDFVRKDGDLEVLTAKAKSLVRKSRARRPEKKDASGVSGNLAEMELVDLLQVLAAAGRTVQVAIDATGGPAGRILLEMGRVVHAQIGDEDGIPAFNILMNRHEGRFTVGSSMNAGLTKRTIDEPLESLLLEACRQRDEAERAGVAAPANPFA